MNKNINNHNGKDIHKDQIQKRVNQEGDTQPVDRVKKKNPDRGKELQPGEPKKAPLKIHKSSTNPTKNAPKGQVIKLGDKERRTQQVVSPVSKSQRQVVNPPQTSTNGKSFTKQSPEYTTRADYSQKYKSEEVNSIESSNTGVYLYVIAAILFISWVIGFFFYKLGANIHMVLALAIVVGVISFLQGRKK